MIQVQWYCSKPTKRKCIICYNCTIRARSKIALQTGGIVKTIEKTISKTKFEFVFFCNSLKLFVRRFSSKASILKSISSSINS